MLEDQRKLLLRQQKKNANSQQLPVNIHLQRRQRKQSKEEMLE